MSLVGVMALSQEEVVEEGVTVKGLPLEQLGKAMRVERGHMGHRTVAPNIVEQVAVELVRLEQMQPTLR